MRRVTYHTTEQVDYHAGVSLHWNHRNKHEKEVNTIRAILTITGPQAKKIYNTLNEPGDEKRYIGIFTRDGRQLIQVIDANDTVHNFDLEGTTVDVKYRRYHNFLTGEVIEENMDFNRWEYDTTGGENTLTVGTTNRFV